MGKKSCKGVEALAAVEVRINPEIFREYDIRGVAERDLTSDVVYTLGQAIGTFLQNAGEKEAIVGRDNRISSPRLRDALVDGITSTGCNVLDIGVVITPAFYYARILYGINGGAMITASHNPPEFNGFKVAFGPGTLYGEQIQDLRKLAESGDFARDGRGRVSTAGPRDAYISMLAGKIQLGPRRLKVAVDCGNGTASFFAGDLMHKLGCDVIPLYCESDPGFPNHFPDPVRPQNLGALIDAVRSQGADLGVAYDGDGDRIGVVDEKGDIIWGDRLMVLFWREILPKHPGATAIIEVKCSQALVEEVERLGGKPMFYRTGHSLIKAKMREIGAVFTGEMSGHMFFADEYYGFDDALYASARLLRILSNTDATLSELLGDVPKYPATPETRVPCPDREKFNVVRSIQEHFKALYPVIDIDGARIIFPSGWGLVRASNTGPELVVRAEAKTGDALDKIKKEIEDALRSFPAVGAVRW
ncbi:MAG: phosphomannomutase/phosphoglucomutase [Firmicutes bacterium]|nr:phosphomannomutase/phosphoglucomutase [Bacillota bacterium]